MKLNFETLENFHRFGDKLCKARNSNIEIQNKSEIRMIQFSQGVPTDLLLVADHAQQIMTDFNILVGFDTF